MKYWYAPATAVGRLRAGESVTETKTVELAFADGDTVRDTDGWVTVQTTAQSAEEIMTVARRRDIT